MGLPNPSRIGNLTWLIHILVYVMTVHTYIVTVPTLELIYYNWRRRVQIFGSIELLVTRQ